MCDVFELAAQAFSRAFNCLTILRQPHNVTTANSMSVHVCPFLSLNWPFWMLIFYMLQVAISRSIAVAIFFLFALFCHFNIYCVDRILPSSISNYIFKWLYNTLLMHLLTRHIPLLIVYKWFSIGKYRIRICEFHDDFNLIFVNKFLGIIGVQHLISDTYTCTQMNAQKHHQKHMHMMMKLLFLKRM